MVGKFRLTIRSGVELAFALVFGLIGVVLFLGTLDEFKAGRAFERAMDAYAERVLEDVHDYLNEAIDAKPSYDPPREVYAKLLLDEGAENPARFADARKVLEALEKRQVARTGRASLAVHIGLALADLGAARAKNPSPEDLQAALGTARSRLEKAQELYPNSGDLHVNLATIAFLEGDLARCKKQHLERVNEAGEISYDGLPYFYNLAGLVALRERRLKDAIAEFEKVLELAPDWVAAKTNLAVARAEAILDRRTDPRMANRMLREMKGLLGELRKAKSPAFASVSEALGCYCLRVGAASAALRYFAEAASGNGLKWHGRFNRAIAYYLEALGAKVSVARRREYFDQARRELNQALASKLATNRDIFVGSCVLGTIEAHLGLLDRAAAHFERAAAIAARTDDPFVKAQLSRVRLSLGALAYQRRDYKTALTHFAGLEPPEEQAEKFEALVKSLREKPRIEGFTARQADLLTPNDLVVSALISLPATAETLRAENVRLTLADRLRGTTRALPFVIRGPLLQATAVNLPQGRYRVELRVTDSAGNQATASSEEFAIDREPPRVTPIEPAPGATVAHLTNIRCRVNDVVSTVDMQSVQVILQMPRGSALSSRLLVSRGRCLYASPDGSITRGSAVKEVVNCPVPKPTPPGTYTVVVEAKDTLGKAVRGKWSFDVKPPQQGGKKQ